MQKRKFFAGLVGPILIIILAFSVMNSGFLKTSRQQMVEVRIEVSYTGPWKGIIYNNGDTQQVSGFSDKTIRVCRPLDGKWDLSFNCEKEDGSTNLLRVSIKSMDGAILEKGYTLKPFGQVQLSVEID